MRVGTQWLVGVVVAALVLAVPVHLLCVDHPPHLHAGGHECPPPGSHHGHDDHPGPDAPAPTDDHGHHQHLSPGHDAPMRTTGQDTPAVVAPNSVALARSAPALARLGPPSRERPPSRTRPPRQAAPRAPPSA